MSVLSGSYQDFNADLLQAKLELALHDGGMLLDGIFPTRYGPAHSIRVTKLGELSPPEVHASRGAPKNYEEANFESRLISNTVLNKDHLIDILDRINLMSTGEAEIIEMMKVAIGMQWDKMVLDIIRGAATVITNGVTSTSTAIQTVAVNSHAFGDTAATNAISLTPSKLKEARVLIGQEFGDIDRLNVLGNTKQFEFLLSFTEVKNGDYRSNRPLEKNTYNALNGYLNMRFIKIEALASMDLVGGAVANNTPVYVVEDRAVLLQIHDPLTVQIERDTSRQANPRSISATMVAGGVRLHDKLVVEIACHTSTHIPA